MKNFIIFQFKMRQLVDIVLREMRNIVVEMTDLFVLVGCDGDELSLWKRECLHGVVGQTQRVSRLDHV